MCVDVCGCMLGMCVDVCGCVWIFVGVVWMCVSWVLVDEDVCSVCGCVWVCVDVCGCVWMCFGVCGCFTICRHTMSMST